MKRSHRSLAAVFVALAAAAIVPLAPAAENFVCGPGGAPDPKTARCICPAGKMEKTIGGTSRCVDKPTIKPPASTKPTTSPTATSTTTSAPTGTTTTMPTSTTAPLPSPSVTTVPVPVPVPTIVIPNCGPGKIWNGATCVGVGGTSGATCSEGRVSDDAGHCCFAGQTWLNGACRGVPSCPFGMKQDGETCTYGACVDGQVRPDGAHCCWPGQAWSDEAHLCVGAPACPEGYQASGEVCVPLRLCDPGMVAVDVEHCCWPGQHWMMRSDGQTGCGGPPKCPSPLVANGDDCLSPNALDEKASHDSSVSLWGPGYFTLELGLNLASGNHSQRWQVYDFSVSVKGSGTPIRFTAGAFGGPVKYTSECASTIDCNMTAGDQGSIGVLGWFGTLAFAPFSIPNASTSSFSLINPWAGITGRAWIATGSTGFSSSDPAAPTSGGAVALSFGDMILIGKLGLSITIEPAIAGGESRPNTLTRFAIAWVPGVF